MYVWVNLCHPWNESQPPVLPRCFTLSADAASDRACCRQYVCLSTWRGSISCKDTIKQLKQEMPDFTGPDLWPPNSPDLSLVDCKVWGVLQQRVYECRMKGVSELKLCLTDVPKSLQQNVIGEWRKQPRACVRADGQHFEHLLQARVTNKSYEQIKFRNSQRCSFIAELVIFWVLKFPKVRYVQ